MRKPDAYACYEYGELYFDRITTGTIIQLEKDALSNNKINEEEGYGDIKYKAVCLISPEELEAREKKIFELSRETKSGVIDQASFPSFEYKTLEEVLRELEKQ